MGTAAPRTRELARLPQPGDIIADKYEVVRVLGEGGMAVVYEAQHLRLRQRLALKVLRPDIPEFAEVLERFAREARATAQLRSIHTARILDVETLPDGLPYMVMEYLEGLDLDAALHASGPMPVDQAVAIVRQVAEVMVEAHGLGIVHRDLKPANLFVCRGLTGDRPLIKVLDFGISKSEDDASGRITQANAYFGTPCYAAPEQLRSASDADPRSDIWSLGIILFELLTGRTPFVGSATAVIAKVLSDPIPWPLEHRPDMPKELARILLQVLERDPDKRYQTMRQLFDALEPFAPIDAVSVPRPHTRLGEILVADGLLTADQLERALTEQRRTGVLLGRVLLDLALVGRDDLLAALAKQQGITTPSSAAVATEPPLRRRTAGAPSEEQTVLSRWNVARRLRRARLIRIVIVVAVAIPLGVLGALSVSAALRGTHVSPAGFGRHSATAP